MAKILLALASIVAVAVGFGCAVGAIVFGVALAFYSTPVAWLADDLPFDNWPLLVVCCSACLIGLIVCIALIWIAGVVFFNWRSASRGTIISTLIVTAVLAAICSLGGMAAKAF